MAEENVIVTRGLTKRFGNKKKSIIAVDNLDLEVHRGEVCFLEPNARGKRHHECFGIDMADFGFDRVFR